MTTSGTNATVDSLRPGDVVRDLGDRWCFIDKKAHPLYPNLMLVIWRRTDGRWSLDALAPRQTVGELEGPDWSERELKANLRAALHGGGGGW